MAINRSWFDIYSIRASRFSLPFSGHVSRSTWRKMADRIRILVIGQH
jgi:hypothetical protein